MSRVFADWRWGCGLFGAMVMLAALSWPTTALADSVESIFAYGSRAPVQFTAKGSNGYVAHVDGSASKVRLVVSGPAGTATYAVPGVTTRRSITASFGKRGRIDVKFRPSRRMRIETPPNRCEGKPRVTRWGVFVGAIRFKGERGFTRIRAGRAGGRTSAFPHWNCRRRQRAAAGRLAKTSAGEEAPVVLDLPNPRLGLQVSAFSAARGEAFGSTAFLASLREDRGRMQITRSSFEIAHDWNFTYDDALTTATVTPPAPFAGEATFEHAPGESVSWTGSLSLVLPGTARIPLVGPRYHPRLYRLSGDGIAKPGV